MKQLTAEQLHRLALGSGAELVIGGQNFNSDREQVNLPPIRRPAPPPQATASPAAQATIAIDVSRILMEQETRLTAMESRLSAIEAVNAALQARVQIAEHAASARPAYTVAVKYDQRGDIETLKLKPEPLQ